MTLLATCPFLPCGLLRAALFSLLVGTAVAGAQDAPGLRERHGELQAALASNPFGRPLHLAGTDLAGELRGEVHAEFAQPFATLGPALQGREHWCELLSLHMNVKSCRVPGTPSDDVLDIDIGRKFDQPLSDAYPFVFHYTLVASTEDYLQVQLQAADGPLGTSAYRITLEAVSLDARRSFLHLSYAYDYGTVARAALAAYLTTIGREKLGFTVIARTASGAPIHTGGTLGVIERNTMRYYIAIEAYLGALLAPPSQQRELRLAAWYDGIERYPLQLHELGREEYLDMKRKEWRREQAGAETATR